MSPKMHTSQNMESGNVFSCQILEIFFTLSFAMESYNLTGWHHRCPGGRGVFQATGLTPTEHIWISVSREHS